ncbi:MAG: hypothetical protein HFF17_09735 [Oscillospiraceae bacterium]|nr:hypothetical protein [Oscillospiraceae bacterium]
MNRKYRIAAMVLVFLVAMAVAWKIGVAKLREETDRVSDDALSLGLGERWGGGLPAGYTAEIADDLASAGHLYARLMYQESVEDLLAKWDAPEAGETEGFAALTAAHAAADIPAAHRALLEDAAVEPDGDWLAFSAEQDGARLILLYDRADMVLYLAEAHP